MTYELNKQEIKELYKIKKAYYMQPTLSLIEEFINSYDDKKKSCKLVFNELYNITTNAYFQVDLILEERLLNGLIKDKKQANKTVVGNTFPFAVIYIFFQNKMIGNIKSDIFISVNHLLFKDLKIFLLLISEEKLKNLIVI